MNTRQQFVLLVGLGLIVLACLFPPWKFTLDLPGQINIEKPGPYEFIFSPPSVPVTDTQYRTFNDIEIEKWAVKIDNVRFRTGLGGVLAITALVFGIFVNRVKKNDI